jgi:hypothetical protein
MFQILFLQGWEDYKMINAGFNPAFFITLIINVK